jgi:hypothetical protein
MFSRPQTAPLRFIATRLELPELERQARQPGLTQAYRLTIQYHDARHPDQVATLIKTQQRLEAALTVHYRRVDSAPLALEYSIPTPRYEAFQAALRKLGFDHLDDPPDVPYYGADLWLVERAAGSFHHDLVFAPALAQGDYLLMMELFQELMHEMCRPAYG